VAVTLQVRPSICVLAPQSIDVGRPRANRLFWQLDKLPSKRDKCKKKSRRYLHLSRVYKRVSERKQRKQRDCLHKATHLIAGKLAERAVVIGDLSQRQMVIKKEENETPKERRKRHIRNRLVYNV
jgi:putative transposase